MVNNISYAEAVKRVQGRTEATRAYQGSAVETGHRQEGGTALTADKLILYIAYVINCTDQVKL